jgi:hypothetical protein
MVSPTEKLSLTPANILHRHPPAGFAERDFQGIPGIEWLHGGTLWACCYGARQAWHGGFLIDEREHVSYPNFTQAADGTIHLIYDHARNVSGDILHVELTEHQIREGLPVLQRDVMNSFQPA